MVKVVGGGDQFQLLVTSLRLLSVSLFASPDLLSTKHSAFSIQHSALSPCLLLPDQSG